MRVVCMNRKIRLYASGVLVVCIVMIIGYLVLWIDRNVTIHNDKFKVLRYANSSINSTHVYHRMLERGFLVGHNPQRNIIRFLPPLTIEESEIARLVTNLQRIFEKMA